MYKTVGALALFASLTLAPSIAPAAIDSEAVVATAGKYRDAVVQFEKTVLRIRGIDRTDERTVDKFEKASKRMLIYSRNPRLFRRLNKEWADVLALQRQTEAAIFRKYTQHHELVRDWQAVLYHQYHFEEELSFQSENPRHNDLVKKRIDASKRSQQPRGPASIVR